MLPGAKGREGGEWLLNGYKIFFDENAWAIGGGDGSHTVNSLNATDLGTLNGQCFILCYMKFTSVFFLKPHSDSVDCALLFQRLCG